MGFNGSQCLLSVDGTDCPIREPSEFSGRWYSHKFKGAGLRYEVAICIQTGWVVWANGPYPCGAFPDIRIFRDRLQEELLPGEMVVADRGYRDGRTFCNTPTGYRNPSETEKANVRSRHEHINGRIKKFKIMSTRFRACREKHWMAFHTIINVLQIEIEEGKPLMQVQYDDSKH
jgi:DDE superfamily endonuclease